ncbi:MAG: cold shock and DUF1294 domain-containing protein [Hydrogenophaga sp.]|nr:cold shock and DUF1294 domain-containing protein [Hydrogenophaga sp.]MDO9148664.1 cold shock and DUF1294 domain-containing protein [Hydrogenophaga sp.]
MRKQGTVVRWNGAKAFGFIKSDQTPADIFFHIRDFSGAPVPTEGLQVGFDEIHVGGKGPRAMQVRPLNDEQNPSNQRPPGRPPRADQPNRRAPARAASGRRASETASQAQPNSLVMALMLVWLVLLVAGALTGRFTWFVLPAAFGLNLVTFYTYWQDKHAARQGAWRIKEDTLHLLGLAGGWPGAWFAHQILRHKSSKQAFRAVYWATAILNTAALLAWVALPWFQR